MPERTARQRTAEGPASVLRPLGTPAEERRRLPAGDADALPALLTEGRHAPGRYAFLAVLLVSVAAFFAVFEAARGIEPALRGLGTAVRGPSLERAAPALVASPVPQATPSTPQAARPAATPAQQAAAPAATPAAPSRATPTATAVLERTHVVEAGDTLWSLAQRYDSTVEAIVAANNLPDRSATLRIGQTLVIPRSRG